MNRHHRPRRNIPHTRSDSSYAIDGLDLDSEELNFIFGEKPSKQQKQTKESSDKASSNLEDEESKLNDIFWDQSVFSNQVPQAQSKKRSIPGHSRIREGVERRMKPEEEPSSLIERRRQKRRVSGSG